MAGKHCTPNKIVVLLKCRFSEKAILKKIFHLIWRNILSKCQNKKDFSNFVAFSKCLNNRFLRERNMVSNSKMEYQIFLCIFQNNSAMATFLKEMGKFLQTYSSHIQVLLENTKKNLVLWKVGGTPCRLTLQYKVFFVQKLYAQARI